MSKAYPLKGAGTVKGTAIESSSYRAFWRGIPLIQGTKRSSRCIGGRAEVLYLFVSLPTQPLQQGKSDENMLARKVVRSSLGQKGNQVV